MALLIFAMVNVVISLYYYLKVLKAAYYSPPENSDAAPFVESLPVKLLSYLMIALMILGGIYPQKIITIAAGMMMGGGF